MSVSVYHCDTDVIIGTSVLVGSQGELRAMIARVCCECEMRTGKSVLRTVKFGLQTKCALEIIAEKLKRRKLHPHDLQMASK